jgi:hypothetical protein
MPKSGRDVIMLRHLLCDRCRSQFLCNAQAHMVGRSSAAVLLLYRDLRGAGRAVPIYMRCAARDTIIITITTTTTTTVSTSVPPT